MMLLTVLRALTNIAILVLLAVSAWLLYVLILGSFWFTINGAGYAIDAPAQIRLSALLLIISVSLAICLLWRVRRSFAK
jgi:hypothetical protein